MWTGCNTLQQTGKWVSIRDPAQPEYLPSALIVVFLSFFQQTEAKGKAPISSIAHWLSIHYSIVCLSSFCVCSGLLNAVTIKQCVFILSYCTVLLLCDPGPLPVSAKSTSQQSFKNGCKTK